MDWLEKHRSKVYFYVNKVMECFDKDGRLREVKGISQPVSIKKILSLQMSKFFKKGYQIYTIHSADSTKDKGPKLEEHELLQEYENVFL